MNRTQLTVLVIYVFLVVIIGVGYIYTIRLLGDTGTTQLFGNAFNLVLGAAVGALSTALTLEGGKSAPEVSSDEALAEGGNETGGVG